LDFPEVMNGKVVENVGFDIVIGNPPYVQLQKIKEQSVILKKQGFETFESTGDLYTLFYEKGFHLLKVNGTHTFITSSQWLKTGYGKSLRKFFLKYNPLILLELGPNIFENATVDSNILIAQKAIYKKELKGIVIKDLAEIHTLSDEKMIAMPYISKENWTIMNPTKQSLKDKLIKKGSLLKDWNIDIYFGVKTGYNQAFLIDEIKYQELIKKDPKNHTIIKPILRGRDIERYITKWDKSYIIFIPWHFPLDKDETIKGSSKKAELEFERKFSALFSYFKDHKEGLSNRNQAETGIRYEWYALQRCAATYKEEFSKEKIIWKRIGSQLRFSYSDEEIFCLDSTCIATGEKMKYLTALLNSKLCHYQLFENAPKTGMGDLIISVQALEPLLVYYPTNKEEQVIEKILNKILDLKLEGEDTTILEQQIDNLVYKLYELTYEEVKIIDPKFPLTEQEYQAITIE
jgi:hypothetical protein